MVSLHTSTEDIIAFLSARSPHARKTPLPSPSTHHGQFIPAQSAITSPQQICLFWSCLDDLCLHALQSVHSTRIARPNHAFRICNSNMAACISACGLSIRTLCICTVMSARHDLMKIIPFLSLTRTRTRIIFPLFASMHAVSDLSIKSCYDFRTMHVSCGE